VPEAHLGTKLWGSGCELAHSVGLVSVTDFVRLEHNCLTDANFKKNWRGNITQLNFSTEVFLIQIFVMIMA